MDNVALGSELVEAGARLRMTCDSAPEVQELVRRQQVARVRNLVHGEPGATGILVRAEIAGETLALDIADRQLSDADLVRWLETNGLNGFGVRLVARLLERDGLRGYAGP